MAWAGHDIEVKHNAGSSDTSGSRNSIWRLWIRCTQSRWGTLCFWPTQNSEGEKGTFDFFRIILSRSRLNKSTYSDSLDLISTVLLITVWLPEVSLHMMLLPPSGKCKQVEQLCNMSHSRPRTCLLSTTVRDMAASTWPFKAEQQFVSLCGESMERKQAVFFGPVATWEKNIRAGL